MDIQEIRYGSREYKMMLELRAALLREPLGLRFETEDLKAEKGYYHFLMCDQGRAVACVLLHPLANKRAWLKQMAVHKNYQKKGLGRVLIAYAEEFAKKRGFEEVVLHARATAVGFYEKQAYKTEGERFCEIGLPHWKMTKRL